MPVKRMRASEVACAKLMRADGWSLRAIAARIGCSPATVGYIVNPAYRQRRNQRDAQRHEAERAASRTRLATFQRERKQRHSFAGPELGTGRGIGD